MFGNWLAGFVSSSALSSFSRDFFVVPKSVSATSVSLAIALSEKYPTRKETETTAIDDEKVAWSKILSMLDEINVTNENAKAPDTCGVKNLHNDLS